MNKEKIGFFANLCIIITFASVMIYLGFKFLLPAVMPFLIGYSVAVITRSPSAFISEKTRVNKKFLRAMLSLILMLSFGGGICFAIVKISTEAWKFFTSISEDGTLNQMLSFLIKPFESFVENAGVPPEFEEKIYMAVSNMISGAISKSAATITGVVSGIPKMLIFVFVTAISTVYFAIEIENVNKCIQKVLPDKFKGVLSKFKKTSLLVLCKYVRSYLLIMFLTFCMMLFGLMLMRVKYALLLSSIIAVLDLLPILGIGIILIPWSMFSLVMGDIKLGVGLIVLYICVSIIREISESRIVGRELGIHPLLTLILMYTGFSLFGVAGLIFLPIIFVSLSAYTKSKKSSADKDHSAQIKK